MLNRKPLRKPLSAPVSFSIQLCDLDPIRAFRVSNMNDHSTLSSGSICGWKSDAVNPRIDLKNQNHFVRVATIHSARASTQCRLSRFHKCSKRFSILFVFHCFAFYIFSVMNFLAQNCTILNLKKMNVMISFYLWSVPAGIPVRFSPFF